ncbi:hypothetical protein J1N35_045645 [Gossypium stocksii]|uniref:RNase H type-1 domain-containing protein n=1 Tax=Gossypium stocksii TaxID=47602 RepID=A0A9D3ZH70_9ROSI|nr:hypothetical protein J1N35_045645 [Gossypium stocksii]
MVGFLQTCNSFPLTRRLIFLGPVSLGSFFGPNDIINVFYCWAKQFLYAPSEVWESQPEQIPRYQKSGMYVFLNTDGAVHSVSGLSAAELWGLLDGLLIAQKQGYNEVIIRLDNLENVISIRDSQSSVSSNVLIRRIQQVLASEEFWSLTYVPSESNQVADALAKMALSRVEYLRIFESPPNRIKEILQEENFIDYPHLNYSM